MSYEFPPERLQNSEAPDPGKLTKAIQPAARRLSELREHNADASDFKANASVDRSAYWKHYAGVKTVGPGLNTNKIPTRGGSSSPDSYVDIPHDHAWHQVVKTGSDVACVAGDKLWINAWAVFSCEGNTSSRVANPDPPGFFWQAFLQFALRINGVVIEDSLVGKSNLGEAPLQPWKHPDPELIKQGTVFFKQDVGLVEETIKVSRYLNTVALNRPGPVRLGWIVEVPDGTHTVELVARRVPDQVADTFGAPSKVGWVSVYNRQISVLRLNQGGAALSPDNVSVDPFEDGDTLTAAELHTQRLEALRTQINDLGEGALAGPSLLRPHLPTGIIETEQELATSFSTSNYTNTWPGYDTDDFDISGPSAGWVVLNELICNGNGNGFNGNLESTIHIMANVEVSFLKDTSGPTPEGRLWALFCLYEKQGSTYTVIKQSECFIPSFMANQLGVSPTVGGATGAGESPELRRDVPLMAVLEHPTGGGPTYDEIGVAVAVYAEPAMSLTPRVSVVRGSIQVFQLKS